MKKRAIASAGILLVFSLPLAGGCTSVAKHAFYELRGAKAQVVLNTEVDARALERYQSIRFTPATTILSSELCPPEVIRAWDHYARDLQEDLRELYPGGTPELIADADILYFQTKGIMSQAQLLTRVRIRTEQQLLADLLVKAESKSFREGGAEDLAETGVKALGKWLRRQKGVEDEDD